MNSRDVVLCKKEDRVSSGLSKSDLLHAGLWEAVRPVDPAGIHSLPRGCHTAWDRQSSVASPNSTLPATGRGKALQHSMAAAKLRAGFLLHPRQASRGIAGLDERERQALGRLKSQGQSLCVFKQNLRELSPVIALLRRSMFFFKMPRRSHCKLLPGTG